MMSSVCWVGFSKSCCPTVMSWHIGRLMYPDGRLTTTYRQLGLGFHHGQEMGAERAPNLRSSVVSHVLSRSVGIGRVSWQSLCCHKFFTTRLRTSVSLAVMPRLAQRHGPPTSSRSNAVARRWRPLLAKRSLAPTSHHPGWSHSAEAADSATSEPRRPRPCSSQGGLRRAGQAASVAGRQRYQRG